MRIPELSKKLHMPAKSLERRIKQLREEGRIVFKGAPKTGGYFIA
jgi:ATP-dependent DNA helicase RecG